MFNWIDVAIFILLIIVAIRGYWSGLIRQVTTIIAIILGIYMAAEQYEVFGNFIHQKLGLDLQLANLIAFIFIIVTISILINYLGQLLNQMLNFLSLTVIDKIGGAAFGVIKGGLIVYILVLMGFKIADTLPWHELGDQLDQSFLVPKFLELNPLLKEQLNKFLESGVNSQ
jgi:membrane protein required for colicin V production